MLFISSGLLSAVIFRKDLRWKKSDLFLIVPLVFFAVSILGRQVYNDYYLYYLDTIRWINEYAVVPGLANVHSRFGFNQFYFYLPAMLETIFPGYGACMANPFCGLVTASFFISLYKADNYRILSAVSLGFIAAYSLKGELSSASPDSAANFFTLIALTSFIRQIYTP